MIACLGLLEPRAAWATGPSGPNLLVYGTNGISTVASGAAASKANGTDFGECALGTLHTNTLYLYNNGDGSPLNFSSIATNGTGFTITGIPLSVAYHAKIPITVVYGAATSGSNAADLVLSYYPTTLGVVVKGVGVTSYTVKLAGSMAAPGFEISTNRGPFAGGNTVTVTNGSFGNITNVLVGGVRATVTGSGATWFTLTMPATGSAGAKDIVVQTGDTGDITLAGAYTVNPAGAIGRAGSITNWTEVSSMPAARRFFGAASDSTKLLTFGGLLGGTYQNTTYSFDGTTWTTEAGTLGASVGFNSGGTLRGVVYSIGGKNASTVLTNVWKWTGSIWVEVAGLPSARWGGAAVTLNDKLYYMAGRNAGNISTTNVYAFDGTNWTEVASLPAPRVVLLGTSLGSRIYAMGGYDDYGSCTNVFVFDGISWTEGTPLPEANTEFAAFSLYDYLYTVGGYNNDGTSTNVFRFDGETWEQVPGLPSGRHGLGAAFLSGFGYSIAGALDGMSKANVYRASWGYSGGVLPVSGLFTGGYEVTITGSNLGNGSDITSVTLGGVSAAILSQSATQIVVTAGVSGLATLGDVRVFSTSFGETVKNNAFEYLRADQAPLVFAPASPQACATTNSLSVSGGSGTGAVSYAVQSGPGSMVGLTNLVVTSGTGSVVVVATKEADELYSALSATATVDCAKGAQSITFAPIASQLTTSRVGLAATAASGLSVTFTVDSGPALITGLTNLTFTGAGSVSIVASQSGDTNWSAAAIVTNTFTVGLADQMPLTFSPSSPQTYGTTNSLLAQQAAARILLQPSPPASGYGTGAVSYAVQSGPGLIVESSKLTVTSGTGSVVVVATKAADELYKARSATATVTCAKAAQSIVFAAIGDQFWTNVVGLAATASSGLTPALEVVSGAAAINGTNLSFTGYGAVSIAAAQAGDDNYSAASSVTNGFTVVGPQLVVLGTNGVAMANSNTVSAAAGTDFGSLMVGSGLLTNTFSVTNTGIADAVISGVTTSGPGASAFALRFESFASNESVVLYDNGPVVTGAGAGFGGADESAITPPLRTYGFSTTMLQDDFTISNTPWNVESLEFYAYKTYSATNYAFSELYVRIWTGTPMAPGSAVVWGDLTSNRLERSYFSNIYRVSVAGNLNADRPLMKLVASTPGLTLPPGTYWVEYTAAGGGDGMSFAPPISFTNQLNTGDALGAGAPLVVTEGGTDYHCGVPFVVRGTRHAAPQLSSLSVEFTPRGGRQDASFSIQYDGTNAPCVLNVTGFGLGGGIALETNQLAYAATYGGANPADQYVALTNIGLSSFSYLNAISYGAGASGWLTVQPASGGVEPDGLATLVFGVTSADLGAGVYVATNALLSIDATNSPQAVVVTLTVGKAGQEITFANPGAQLVTNIVTLAATASSGLPVSFALQSGAAGLYNSSNLAFSASSTVTVVASQAGNANWSAAASVTQAFAVLNVITALTDNAEVTVPEGGMTTFRVKLSSPILADVVVAVARISGDSDLTVTNGASLTFTPANWASYQTVALVAAEDNGDNVDGKALFAITAEGIGSASVTANEADDDYTLTVTTTNGTVAIGSNDKHLPQRLYDYGTVVTLTAIPNESFAFVEWMDDATGTDNPVELTMDGDKSVAAFFVPVPPKALPPRTIAKKNFTARWQWVAGGAPEGELSVASDAGFANRVPGYEKLYVCNDTECSVTNLVANRDYWYRVRRLITEGQLSGPSDWSKAVKVRTGQGMPVFTSLLFDSPVGKGATQEFALTNLVRGTGVFSVKSSDTNNVDVRLTPGSLLLHYGWKGTGESARVTMTLKHPETGYRSSYEFELDQASGEMAVVSVGALTPVGKRLVQEVTLENRTGGLVYGARLRVNGLNKASWLINRSGNGPDTEDPILEVPCLWPAGSQAVFRVVYHADFATQGKRGGVEYVGRAIMAPLGGAELLSFGLPISTSAAYEGGDLWLLGLPVIGNRWYTVLHSDDAGASWVANGPSIRATANYLMWLDLEAVSGRLYEVKEAVK